MKKLRLFKSPLSIRFKYWLLAVVASAAIVGFPYIAVQQNYRQNANDPQIQYAQDLSAALEQGASPEAFGGNSPVDPRKSLGLFLMVLDEQKKVVANTMQVEGDAPVPPNGTFDAAKNKGQQRFTWRPKNDIRIAAVMQYYKGSKPGYLLVGRSISEVENRQKDLLVMAGGAFVVLVALATIGVRMSVPPRAARAKADTTAPGPLSFDDEGGNNAETTKSTVVASEKPAIKKAGKSTKTKTTKKPVSKKSAKK